MDVVTVLGFVSIAIILLFMFQYNNVIDTNRFIKDSQPYFKFLMEEDYKFLLAVKYGSKITERDVDTLFGQRIRNGMITILAMIFINLSALNFIWILASILIGFIMFKSPYSSLKKIL